MPNTTNAISATVNTPTATHATVNPPTPTPASGVCPIGPVTISICVTHNTTTPAMNFITRAHSSATANHRDTFARTPHNPFRATRPTRPESEPTTHGRAATSTSRTQSHRPTREAPYPTSRSPTPN